MNNTSPLTSNQIKILKKQHLQNNRLVLVTGVFDVLHSEHIKFLSKAKQAGDFLVVGLESDVRVKHLKGNSRPINTQENRLNNLANTGIPNLLFILPQQFSTPRNHLDLLRLVKPDILAVSAHTPHLQEKKELMFQVGGSVRVVLSHNRKQSSTILISSKQNPTPPLHPFYSLAVKSGFGRGKKIGFPTLNFIIPQEFPYNYGVYGGEIKTGGKTFQAAIHFGPIPTFKHQTPSLEAHLLTQNNLHLDQKPISLRLSFFLRPIIKFSSQKHLVKQIFQDTQNILSWFNQNRAKTD